MIHRTPRHSQRPFPGHRRRLLSHHDEHQVVVLMCPFRSPRRDGMHIDPHESRGYLCLEGHTGFFPNLTGGCRHDVGIRGFKMATRLEPSVEVRVEYQQNAGPVRRQHNGARRYVPGVVLGAIEGAWRVPEQCQRGHLAVPGTNVGSGVETRDPAQNLRYRYHIKAARLSKWAAMCDGRVFHINNCSTTRQHVMLCISCCGHIGRVHNLLYHNLLHSLHKLTYIVDRNAAAFTSVDLVPS